MKTKILVTLALLTVPSMHAADPQAGTSVETDPQLIAEFCVDHVESIAFKEFFHDTLVAFCYLDAMKKRKNHES